MEITIPNHKAVSWNKLYSQGHWSKRARLVNEIHEFVFAYSYNKLKFKKKVDITITAYFKDKRLRDCDNIFSKAYIDSLKGNVIEDDDWRYVRSVTKLIKPGQKEDKVVIEIREVEK